MKQITESMLRAIAPKLSNKHPEKARQSYILREMAEVINELMVQFEVNTIARQTYFLAQTCHEAAGFRTTVEYASGRAYEGRRDLGNTQKGDGKKFRGHGIIQTTGRANHAEFTEWCRKLYPDCPDFEQNPELLAEFPWAILSAFWYWETRNLNEFADRGDFKGATKRINGGYNGMADRRKYLARAEAVLGDSSSTPLLRLGSEGSDVFELQTRLKQCNYRIGSVDGDFGTLTEAGVRDYQADMVLTVDGKVRVGGETWKSLGESISAGWKRPLSEERQDASGKDLGNSRIVAASDRGSGAGILGTISILGATYWDRGKELIDRFASPEYVVCAILGVVSLYLWFQLQKARAARIDDHQRGKTL